MELNSAAVPNDVKQEGKHVARLLCVFSLNVSSAQRAKPRHYSLLQGVCNHLDILKVKQLTLFEPMIFLFH